MKDFKIEVEEKRNYNTRVLWAVLLRIAPLAIILPFLFYSSTIPQASQTLFCCFILVIIILPILLSIPRQRSYITYIELKNGMLSISYKDGMTNTEVSGNIKDFSFDKKYYSAGKSSRPYLRIHYNDNIIIRQYLIGNWNRDKLNLLYTAVGIEPVPTWITMDDITSTFKKQRDS